MTGGAQTRDRLPALRPFYLHAGVVVVATLLLHELPPGWVVAGWAALAVVLLVGGRPDAHWRLAALAVVVVSVVRGLAVDVPAIGPSSLLPDLVSVPLACAALLAGYALIRLRELGAEAAGDPPEGWRRHLAWERHGWRLGLLVLTFCVLKLFVYDLRGLTGLPRILSFIVLGVVLIAVSWIYTRYRERVRELL